MATKLKAADIVIVGLGWTGGILAKELADTGLSIVVLERGKPRDTNPDFAYPNVHDELKYAQRHELMQDVSRETLTFRNNSNETALPMRQLGSFLPGEGVGGAGVHWNGVTWRWLPWDHEPEKMTLARYGKSAIPEGMQLQDWGVSYDELEPYYDKFEYLCGVGGKAGNLGGKKIDGGRCLRRRAQNADYPNPPGMNPDHRRVGMSACARLRTHLPPSIFLPPRFRPCRRPRTDIRTVGKGSIRRKRRPSPGVACLPNGGIAVTRQRHLFRLVVPGQPAPCGAVPVHAGAADAFAGQRTSRAARQQRGLVRIVGKVSVARERPASIRGAGRI